MKDVHPLAVLGSSSVCKYSFKAFPNATPRAERAESVTSFKGRDRGRDRGRGRYRSRGGGR